ncbi:hypothetical protein DSO57_1036609 [Entomophthora muscae]|uniref:Uncharacterized protein n=1 Tax=Entomophthora muscae TaxID=34485 RepID=A0ACC2UK69_9FUNG|nr:hypothetical protein DSO57_1036609 [Entomophthora muscae]
MNHLIFSAVLTACLEIGGHQHSHQHEPYNKPPDEYFYEEPAQLNSSETYYWPTPVSPAPPSTLLIDDDNLSNCDSAHRLSSCQLGVPFGPINFTEYPLKPEYKDYTPEKILKLDLLACIQSAVRYNCQGPWIFSTPKLFRGKFNYLPSCLQTSHETACDPKPIPASSPDFPTNYTGKLFGIEYITLTGPVVLGGKVLFLPL